jgi:diguanylate cyclase (GGDEF)-like protein
VSLLIDVDGLKQVNDTHGHAAGDDVIRTVALAIAHTLRESDFDAR